MGAHILAGRKLKVIEGACAALKYPNWIEVNINTDCGEVEIVFDNSYVNLEVLKVGEGALINAKAFEVNGIESESEIYE